VFKKIGAIRGFLKNKSELLDEIESLEAQISVLKVSSEQWRKSSHLYAEACKVHSETAELLMLEIARASCTLASVLAHAEPDTSFEQLADMAATHILVLEDKINQR
jgi:hypothetical protein